jgi:hypothetical protein
VILRQGVKALLELAPDVLIVGEYSCVQSTNASCAAGIRTNGGHVKRLRVMRPDISEHHFKAETRQLRCDKHFASKPAIPVYPCHTTHSRRHSPGDNVEANTSAAKGLRHSDSLHDDCLWMITANYRACRYAE